MGRRAVRVDEPSRWVFNRLASAYRSRPPYPESLVVRLLALAGGTGARVVDLGAGTGLLAIPLAVGGAHVTAVEPAQAMLDVLRERTPVEAAERVVPVLAAAERSGLPAGSADLILVADALHWMDPELAGLEAARLLRPGGTVAVVEAALAPTAFMSALGELIVRANPKARRRHPGALEHFLALATGGRGRAPAETERLLHAWPLDGDRLAALLRSLSHVGPALGPARLDALLDEARRLAASFPEARWTRELTLSWAVRGSPPP